MATKRIGMRDTAKDIMLGTAPSGLGPKMPKDTGRRMMPQQRPRPPQKLEPIISPVPPPPDPRPVLDPAVIERLSSAERTNRSLMEELMRLQNEFRNFQGHHTNALSQEQEARKRLEGALRSSSDSHARMAERLKSTENGTLSKQDLDDHKRARTQLEAELFRTQQDLAYLKGVVERQANDLIMLNSEIRSRPVIDPSKMNNNQHLESDVRDIHGQMMNLRQAVDGEVQERRRIDQEHQANLARLQAQLAEQEARKNDILRALAAQENSKNTISEEARRLNAKIGLITVIRRLQDGLPCLDEVTRNMMANEQRLRDENDQRYSVLEKAIKAELEARLQFERDIKLYIDQRWKQYQEEMAITRQQMAEDREKQRHQTERVEDALGTIERHLEQGNRKVDRVLEAEIQSRRLNEKALLSRLGEIEDRLHIHVGDMRSALDDVKNGRKVEPPPPVDTAALRSELEAIASDKHRLSMEGLLKLEERMNRIEEGMDRDTKELHDRLSHLDSQHQDVRSSVDRAHETANAARLKSEETHARSGQIDEDSLARIRHQLQALDDAQHEIGRAHDRLKVQVENQIPKDIAELDAKCKQRDDQLAQRLDREEKDRYHSVKDLEDEVAKLKNRPSRNLGTGLGTDGVNGRNADVNQHVQEKLQNEVDECQIGIKKLAESVTTVKNVLERKVTEEARTREKDIDEVHRRIDSLND